MNAFALHATSDDASLRRWGFAAAAILAAHAVALILLGLNWTPPPTPGVAVPAIMVDLAPMTSSPEVTPMDVAPGPAMQEADASPPEPAPAPVVQELLAPTPPQEKPDVVAPPEQKQQAVPEKPEPARIVPEQKPAPVKPKVVRREAKKPSEAPPAPRTSAPPRTERQAPAQSAISAGASASAIAAYNARVRAHLMRFHSYPSAGGGQRGVVRLTFTLSRSGAVTGSRVGSSGIAAFDAAAAAMIRQASPFPPFPPEIAQGSMGFSIPVAFTVR